MQVTEQGMTLDTALAIDVGEEESTIFDYLVSRELYCPSCSAMTNEKGRVRKGRFQLRMDGRVVTPELARTLNESRTASTYDKADLMTEHPHDVWQETEIYPDGGPFDVAYLRRDRSDGTVEWVVTHPEFGKVTILESQIPDILRNVLFVCHSFETYKRDPVNMADLYEDVGHLQEWAHYERPAAEDDDDPALNDEPPSDYDPLYGVVKEQP